MAEPDTIVDCLQLGSHSVVALAGAGGKTTTMWTLVRRLFDRGERVACTTTTRIGKGDEPDIVKVVPWPGGNIRKALDDVLDSGKIPLILTSQTEDGKLRGVNPEQSDLLAEQIDHLVIEADGARRLPVKIPRPHEPVMGGSTTHLVIIAGLMGLGRPAGPDTVFEYEKLLAAHRIGARDVLDPETLRSVLYGPGGWIDRFHGPWRTTVMVNGDDLQRARPYADALFHTDLDGVIVANARKDTAIRVTNAHHRVAAIVLAAGTARRFGTQKMLDIVDGKPMVKRIVDTARHSNVDEIVLVVGHDAEAVTMAAGIDDRIRVVHNDRHAEGMASSLRCGIESAGHDADAAMVLLGDMPRVGTDLVSKVLEAYRNSAARIAAPFIDGRTGHPAILRSDLFDDVMSLTGDAGARPILQANLERAALVCLDDDSTQHDVDTPADLRRFTSDADS